MLLILYIYLLIQLWRVGNEAKKNYEKLRRENTQLLLDADRMMREIADSFQTKRVKSELPFAGGRVDPNHACSDRKFPRLNCDSTEQTDEQMLKQCINEENYELAAVIRDRIKSKK